VSFQLKNVCGNKATDARWHGHDASGQRPGPGRGRWNGEQAFHATRRSPGLQQSSRPAARRHALQVRPSVMVHLHNPTD
jgi:hypothetical protein